MTAEQKRAYQKEYRDTHRDKNRQYQRDYRARMKTIPLALDSCYTEDHRRRGKIILRLRPGKIESVNQSTLMRMSAEKAARTIQGILDGRICFTM